MSDRAADKKPWRGTPDVTIYGRRAVLEALEAAAAGHVGIGAVRVARETPAPFRKELAEACRAHGVALDTTDYKGVLELSGNARQDQGVAARIRLSHVTGVDAFIDSLKGRGARDPARILALDNITNPENIGMIVRSALASGMTAMLWPTVGSPWVNGLIVKSSAATVYRCPIVVCGALAEGLGDLKRHGFRLYGLQSTGAASLFDCRPAHRAAFILGGETTGISPDAESLLDDRLAIPMKNGVESLNVAAAATLLCFHVSSPLTPRHLDTSTPSS